MNSKQQSYSPVVKANFDYFLCNLNMFLLIKQVYLLFQYREEFKSMAAMGKPHVGCKNWVVARFKFVPLQSTPCYL